MEKKLGGLSQKPDPSRGVLTSRWETKVNNIIRYFSKGDGSIISIASAPWKTLF